uniref:tRNA (Cytosine(38)-C(5))-methyltransferase n=1 Tax=Auxenochlorella protothecoides TaxID=3075 RepID=A0A1D2ABX7_AUXPR
MRAVEFYSGLGGLHYALALAVPGAEVVTAFDINDTANDVYQHNFGRRPSQSNIDSLTAARLDRLRAELWLLSPPCQPYTRRGLQRQSADGRAASFLSLLRRLGEMQHPPTALLLENVVGFEASDTCAAMLRTLRDLGYAVLEVLASPTDLGLPYSRPRYFALATRARGAGLARHTLPFVVVRRGEGREPTVLPAREPTTRRPLADFLEADPAAELAGGVRLKLPDDIRFKATNRGSGDVQAEVGRGDAAAEDPPPSPTGAAAAAPGSGPPLAAPGSGPPLAAPGSGPPLAAPGSGPPLAAPASATCDDPFRVPDVTLLKNGWCMDVVTPSALRTCCFTKTYGQYIKGSGSVLTLASEDSVRGVMQRFPCLVPGGGGTGGDAPAPSAASLAEALRALDLRFFSPREIANLHGFPPAFAFPPAVTLRQRYALLGNSLHVGVVARLLGHLLAGAGEGGVPG